MLRMLAGLEVPSEGEIRLGGKRINELSTWQRDTPMVWQSLALFPFLTVQENVEFGLRMRRVAKAERRRLVDKWLERMRSEEHTSALQSLMRITYAVYCLKKKKG